jgi:hypothetical protein
MGVKMGSAAVGIGAVISTVLVERGIKKLLPNLFGVEVPTLDTPLEKFEGSHGYAKRLSVAKDSVNWAQLYEELCVLDPEKTQNDPRIPEVLAHYKALLNGTELDLEGRHVPNEQMSGRPNPDYSRYMKAQAKAARKAGQKAAGMRREAKVSGYRKSLEEVRNEMIVHLVSELNCPMCVAGVIVTNDRLENTTPETWRQISRFAGEYVKIHGEAATETFAELATTVEFLDSQLMEEFAIYFEQRVPKDLAMMIIRGEISGAQAERAASLVDNYRMQGMTWKVALRKVLTADLALENAEDLRDSYRSIIDG